MVSIKRLLDSMLKKYIRSDYAWQFYHRNAIRLIKETTLSRYRFLEQACVDYISSRFSINADDLRCNLYNGRLPPLISAGDFTPEDLLLELINEEIDTVGPSSAAEVAVALAFKYYANLIKKGEVPPIDRETKLKVIEATYEGEIRPRKLLEEVVKISAEALKENDPIKALDALALALLYLSRKNKLGGILALEYIPSVIDSLAPAVNPPSKPSIKGRFKYIEDVIFLTTLGTEENVTSLFTNIVLSIVNYAITHESRNNRRSSDLIDKARQIAEGIIGNIYPMWIDGILYYGDFFSEEDRDALMKILSLASRAFYGEEYKILPKYLETESKDDATGHIKKVCLYSYVNLAVPNGKQDRIMLGVCYDKPNIDKIMNGGVFSLAQQLVRSRLTVSEFLESISSRKSIIIRSVDKDIMEFAYTLAVSSLPFLFPDFDTNSIALTEDGKGIELRLVTTMYELNRDRLFAASVVLGIIWALFHNKDLLKRAAESEGAEEMMATNSLMLSVRAALIKNVVEKEGLNDWNIDWNKLEMIQESKVAMLVRQLDSLLGKYAEQVTKKRQEKTETTETLQLIDDE